MPSRLLPGWHVLILLALGLPGPAWARPFVEHLEPPVLARGQTTSVTAVGAGLGRAEGLWTTLPPGQVRATPAGPAQEGRATLAVTVAADAPVGLVGLRIATGSGLSNLVLALIDDLPVRAAPSPADKAPAGKAPAPVTLPAATWGRFRDAEVDRFSLTVRAGQAVSFEVVGNRLGKDVDPLVTVRDGRGRVVAQHDNSPGLYFDCRFEHTFADAGTYTVEVSDARFQGHEHGFYVLRMGRFPAARVASPAALRPGQRARLLLPELGQTVEAELPADHAAGPLSWPTRRPGDEGSGWVPLEVSDLPAVTAAPESTTPARATPAPVPAQLCGVLARPGERHLFRLDLAQNQKVHATGHGPWHNSPIDLGLTLTDETGRELTRATPPPQQGGPGGEETVRLNFAAPKTGKYFLSVRDTLRGGGPAWAYRVEVRDGLPAPAVVAEAEGLTVPRGGFQSVPLVLTRNGLAGPVALTLLGAPPGLTLTPAEIPEGADSVVCRLSAGPATPRGLHTLRLRAHSPGNPGAPAGLVRTRPMIDRQLLNVDLIPYALREDQTRLPPGVAEQLALQVTDAAPFTVELPVTRIVLPRYQRAAIPVVTTRAPGFDGPITFTASGGQLADKAEGRTRVYAEFPPATPKDLAVAGSVHSRILTNLGTTRIEVRASAVHEGRTVTLLRTFDLETRTAFTVAAAGPGPAKLTPGGATRVRLKADRVTTFRGAVTVSLPSGVGLTLPESVTIPAGQDSVEFEVATPADAPPGRRSLGFTATGEVDGFEEEARGNFEVEVPRPDVPKKK